MSYNPIPPNGQATMANSQPVVVASDQSSLLVSPRVVSIAPVPIPNTNVNPATLAQSLISLANFSAAVSDRIDISYSTTVNSYSDVMIGIRLVAGGTAPTGDRAIYIYIAPWYKQDNTPTWIAPSIGSTNVLTSPQPTLTGYNSAVGGSNLRLASILPVRAAGVAVGDTIHLRNVFSGNLPDAFSVVVYNATGSILSNQSGNFSAYYTRLI